MASSEPDCPMPLARTVTFNNKKLCDNCDELDLSVDKFVIGKSSLPRLIKRSVLYGRNIRRTTAASGIQLNSGLGELSPGSILALRESTCPLCELMYKAIDQYTIKAGAEVDELSKCYMAWEVDGRRARGHCNSNDDSEDDREQYANVSRRIRFRWEQKDKKAMEVYILLVAPNDQDDEHTSRQSQQKPAFLAKKFDPSKSKHSVIKGWLSLCEKEHKSCTASGCAGQGSRDTTDGRRLDELLEQTSFGVVDVTRMKLCRLPSWKMQYVALSYVWGQGDKSHQTQRDNVLKRTSDAGIEEGNLPKTIQDAIQLTRDLGLQYIWIDSLCIVQDSTSSFRLNAANMDLIYGNAYLTICAADGEDAHEGLAALDPKRADEPLWAEYREDIRLQVTRPSESVIHASVWNQRAWTFQERILSRRCLVFAGRRVYFQCRSSNMSEDIHRDANGRGLSMDMTNSPLRTLKEMQPRPIKFYMTCVSLYTGRHLTYAKDIIPAFEGVSNFMQNRMHGSLAQFIYGLPPSHFDLALLWEPLSAQKRRYPSSDAGTEVGELELPSWSWAGWMDVADEDVRKGSKGSPVKYKPETLEGCFIDVRDWLRKHTWINWYIRNDEGDLRPLWDKEYLSEVEGKQPEKRWQGYEASPRQGPRVEASVFTGNVHPEASPYINETERYSDAVDRNADEIKIEVKRIRHRNLSAGSRDDQESEFEHSSRRNARDREHMLPSEREELEREIRALEKECSALAYEREEERSALARERERMENELERARLELERLRLEQQRTHENHENPQTQPKRDRYGRRIGKIRSPSFTKVIPDNPFGVNKVNFGSRRGVLPDQGILQFFTWDAQFYVLERTKLWPGDPGPGERLVRCDIADENKDWCGHIVLNADWMDNHKKASDQKARFIAISEAKSFTNVECPNWAHYIPQELEDVEWDLVFVLLIELNPERLVWERVGLGKVFRAAFDLDPNWEEIVLG